MDKTLTERTLSGLNWSFLKTYGNAIINIIVGIVLARLIPPQEFGLLGMTLIFTGLADLFVSLGMGPSIIQLKELKEEHLRVGLTFTLSSSVLMYLLFFFTAPYIARFFNEERLVLIIRVISLLFIEKGITTVSSSLLVRKMDFKTIMIIDSIAFIIGNGTTSVILAIMGFGVWSLVFGRLVGGFITSVLYLIKSRISFKPLIRKKEFKDLLVFGGGVSLSQILLYGSSNVDYLIIGKYLSPFQLGLYTKAFNLMSTPINQIGGSIYNVLFPAFSSVQSENEKLRIGYFRTVRTVSYFLFPVLAAMAVSAKYIIIGLYGSNWEGAVNVFRILCIGGILRTTLSYSGSILVATGRIFAEVMQQLFYLLILGGCALIGVRYGIEFVGIAVVIALTWMFYVKNNLAMKIIEGGWKNYISSVLPGIINLIIIVFLNLIIIFLTENIIPSIRSEIKLLITISINVIGFLFMVFLIPEKIKGDSFSWLLEKYNRFIPKKITNLYYYYNPTK